MSTALFAGNLAVYSAQLVLLILFAAVTPFLTRMKAPRIRLAFFQLVLVACLLLPVIRSWKREVIVGSVQITTGVVIEESSHSPRHINLSMTDAVLFVIAAGAMARLMWLFSGFRSLRRYRMNSHPLIPASSWAAEADVRVSDEVSSPVTFGFRHPVVLLPSRFPELDEQVREAILCHEVLHVRRHDWLFTLWEELVRTVLWFHPAIWWLLSQIQLEREQAVDLEAIAMIRSREAYVDALLAIAAAPRGLSVSPAPLFLRKRHLKQRVLSILKEVRMSQTRSVVALATGTGMLAAVCWFVTGALPLTAAPQSMGDSPGVAIETNGAKLMHRSPVIYPHAAAAKAIEGTVTAQVRLDDTGNVVDASIVSGPDELRKPVLESVLNWHFSKDSAPGTRQVSVTFAAPAAGQTTASQPTGGILGGFASNAPVPGAASNRSAAIPQIIRTEPIPQSAMIQESPRTLRSILFGGIPQDVQTELLSQLPVHEGDTLSPEMRAKTAQAVRAFDEHLTVSFQPVSPTEMSIRIMANNVAPFAFGAVPPPPPPPGSFSVPPNPQTIRVGGNVAQFNLINQVQPVYPPLAKSARVQGTVRFEVTIGKDGRVQNVQLVSGHPLLVLPAMEAVRQWVYKPTLLNGNPVEIITTVDVNFTLAE